ncbi:MAG: hypothetical protein HUJ25_12050 [Crocinitomicaceae bacterium]|nr:hypothetical protein [Crocinitomicaceae bacterium]
MEKINLHNYEAFFLDYMEGNLNVQQEFELMDFLEKHPELKAELEHDFEEVILSPVEDVKVDKSSLKKEGIQPEEMEEWMIASVEGQLSQEEEVQLLDYVQKNHLEKTLRYYQNTILVANPSEVYGNTADLKKKDAVILPLIYRVVAAAAVIVLLFGIVRFNSSDPVPGNNNLSETNVLTADSETGTKRNLPSINNKVFDSNLSNDPTNSYTSIDNENFIAVEEEKHDGEKLDSTHQQINLVKEKTDFRDPIAENTDSTNTNPDQQPLEDDSDLALTEPKEESIITEEPIKVFTDIAGSIFNRNISYERQKKSTSGDYVAHHVKLGKFEFQRKKH